MRVWKIAALCLALASPAAARTAAHPPADVAAAVANTAARSPDNVKMDESRKPTEVLRFFGLKRGMNVIDLFGSNRYWAEIFAPTVGPKGRVLVWEPSQFYKGDGKAQ